MRFVKTRDRVQDLDADTITTLLYAQSSVLSTGNYFTNYICLLWQINSRFFPSSSARYRSAQLTTIAIASSFVYFFMFLNPLSGKKREDCNTAVLLVFSSSDWFFCRPPTLSSIWSKTILLHQFRVFLLPANAPSQSTASISDLRCQSHQEDDASYPSLLYAKRPVLSTGNL